MAGTMRNRRLSWTAVVGFAGVVLLGAWAAGAVAQVAPGCSSLATGSIVESSQFTSPDQVVSGFHPPDAAINPATYPLTIPANSGDMPSAIDGMSLVYVRGSSWYYFRKALPETMTFSQFMAAGGVAVERHVAAPDQQYRNYTEYLLGELGDRAVAIDIGPYPGALIWADPASDGTRSHNVSWSTADFEYTLWAVRTPEVIVNLARGAVCGT
jgi:hypothetical protein